MVHDEGLQKKILLEAHQHIEYANEAVIHTFKAEISTAELERKYSVRNSN